MRGYRFPSTETEHQTVISRFGGADFFFFPIAPIISHTDS